MSLQPTNLPVDRSTTTPFLLRLFWRQSSPLSPHEFAIAPPADTSNIPDYTSLLPSSIRQQSVQIYTWPTCTLSELTGLLTSVLPAGLLPSPSAGTRLVFKLIFPDTRGQIDETGRGRWVDRQLGSVVLGASGGGDGDEVMGVDDVVKVEALSGDADKTLSDARFVIGDYVACTIYPPGADGRVAPLPPPMSGRGPRDAYAAPRGRENGYGPPRGGSYRGSYGGRGGGAAPPADMVEVVDTEEVEEGDGWSASTAITAPTPEFPGIMSESLRMKSESPYIKSEFPDTNSYFPVVESEVPVVKGEVLVDESKFPITKKA
ncbi:hypothetical protein LTR09_001494 [Extremus antarcticus]|uniref:Sin3-associated polypeptide Sap18 n=1 Tax=Extremus antarcticus TaxID=702011 RepID=A0AAJ0GGU4_9PEZI|nr:hypothetical protein LTR09_001494 [Extremus antarcticus]